MEAVDLNKMKDLKEVSGDMRESLFNLLEFAANNDVESLKRCFESDASVVNCVGLWYVRNKDSKKIMEEERTLLMVAASYGSLDVSKFLVSISGIDLNKACGRDKWTALHCAASGASIYAFDVVKLLLSVGCDPSIRDANGRRPIDVIVVPPKIPGARAALEDLFLSCFGDGSVDEFKLSNEIRSPDFVASPVVPKAGGGSVSSVSEKKQYPVDPSFPDIRDSVYSSDEFRMYAFKVRPCSRAYSHDWTECPFAHPGENARRRDPRKYHYSCVPCPDFRKGACRRGDMCEYAHGVFECWLHPAQYRTRLCKDGVTCARQVCFFAHTQEELRPLYVSTGSGVPSPRSTGSAPSYMDMAAALNLIPGSPTSQSLMSPVFNQTLSSPSGNGISHATGAWPQNNVPTLYLPGSNLHSSRLRSSLNARDIPPEDLNVFPDYDTSAFGYMDRFSQPRSNSPMSFGHSKAALTPSNLEELFSSEIASSPKYSDQAAAFGAFSPTHKSAVLNQFHPQQSTLPPINTGKVFSPRNVERSLLQASFGVSSPRMSPRSTEPASPVANRLAAFAGPQQQQMRSLGPNHGGSMTEPPTAAWSSFGSPNGKHDWISGVDNQQPYELKPDGDEPDLSWVQSLVKEPSPEMMDKTAARISSAAPPSGECPPNPNPNPNPRLDSIDHSVLAAWLEQMQLDQLTA